MPSGTTGSGPLKSAKMRLVSIATKPLGRTSKGPDMTEQNACVVPAFAALTHGFTIKVILILGQYCLS